MDKFTAVRKTRKAVLSLLGRDHGAVLFQTVYGFAILIPGWDPDILIAALNGRILHPRLTEIFLAVIEPGDTFVDAGANVGFYSLLAATALKGDGHVVSFEPDRRNYPILRSNAKINHLDTLIQVEPKALSDRECELAFWSAPNNSWGGSLVELPDTQSRKYIVSATTLDQYVASAKLDHVDIIKLDIEGAEPLALHGMPSALRTARLVAYEINKPRLNQLKVLPMDLIEKTSESGQFEFTLISNEQTDEFFPLEDIRSTEILNNHDWANVVSAKGDAAHRLREMFRT
jgi:FkbM family methyltransferase